MRARDLGQSAEQIVEQVLSLPEGTRFTVDAPVVRTRKGEYRDLFEQLRADGFTRVKVDGEDRLLEEPIDLDKQIRHSISVVVDRLVMKDGLRTRLTDSLETALRLAEGLVEVAIVDGATVTYSEKFACPDDGVSLPELAPRIFSFNSPHGACPRCTGLGSQREIDPDLVVPDPSLSISQGALVPWTVINSSFYEQVIQAIADRYEIDLETPWQDLPEVQRELFLNGTGGEKLYVSYRNSMGRKRSYTLAFEGILPSLDRRYRDTDSSYQKERIEEYMALKPCPACHGDRLKPTSLAVTIGGINIAELTRMSVTTAIEFVDGLVLTDTERAIGARILREIRERLVFLENVGVGYLTLNRTAASLSGGEAQRIRLATQIGASLMGVLYILDEPSIGLHQRDNARLLATLVRLRDLGNTVIVVEHDEETIRAADFLVDMGPGAGEHGGRVVAERHGRPGRPRQGVDHRRVSVGPARHPDAGSADPRRRLVPDRGRGRAQPEGHRRRAPGRQVHLRDRRQRVGQVDARERGRLQVARQPAEPSPDEAGEALGRARHRRVRQGHRHRPVADRPHAAVERCHLHRPLRPHPRPLLDVARRAGQGLQAGPVLVQRQGRAVRDLPRRRHDQDRDALPARRLHQLRGVPRAAVQPRDARGEVQGQVDRRRPRHVDRGGARVLHESRRSGAGSRRCTTSASTTCASASRRRPCRAARPSA